jgi:hypothetical protein
MFAELRAYPVLGDHDAPVVEAQITHYFAKLLKILLKCKAPPEWAAPFVYATRSIS